MNISTGHTGSGDRENTHILHSPGVGSLAFSPCPSWAPVDGGTETATKGLTEPSSANSLTTRCSPPIAEYEGSTEGVKYRKLQCYHEQPLKTIIREGRVLKGDILKGEHKAVICPFYPPLGPAE